MKKISWKKGSTFLISLIFAVIVSLGAVSLVTLQLNFHNITTKNLNRINALYNAESGIQLAMHELRHKNSADRFKTILDGATISNWTIDGTKYEITLEGITYSIKCTSMPTN